MKKLLYIIIPFFTILTTLSSCEDMMGDFLDKAPGVDVSEDTIFSSKTQVETFVIGTYYYTLVSDVLAWWDARDKADGTIASATDECELFPSWFSYQGVWNQAGMNPSSQYQTGDQRFETYWIGIRRANIIIERIEDAPFDDSAYKKQALGEAQFMRAFNHFEMFKRYGGIPIVEKRFLASDDLNIPRRSVEDVVKFISDECDKAYNNLPHANEMASNQRGRATKAAALALKARTLLYAASKTFNTAKPYLDFGSNNNLICYTNYDKNRWKLAADAAKAVLDEAQISGIALVTDQGSDKNYRYVWETPDNSEIILAEKHTGMRYAGHFPWSYYLPSVGGYWVTFNFMKLYERKDGTQQPWNDEGGENLMDIFNNMDPRFRQTFSVHGDSFNGDFPNLDFAKSGNTDGRNTPKGGGCEGAIVHKPLPYTVQSTGNVGAIPNGLIFKLSEFYLSYAEALNEYYDTPPTEAYDAIDEIRVRSGMPKLPRSLSQADFQKRVRNERAIELAFDGHRLWDIRRWEIADDGIMKGSMYGIKQYKIAGSSEIRYEPYVFETRSFKSAMYRNPFVQTEVDKGYLIQNPGY